jgi:hypothetical protein
MRLNAATGFLQFTPYYDSTYGAFINSLNAAASAYLPITIQGSKILMLQGNVGIGTTSPAYKLDVSGTGRFVYADNSYGEGLTIKNTTNNTAAQSRINIANSADNLLVLIKNSPSVNSGVAYVGTSSTESLTLGVNYATALTIASTGAATFSSSVTASGGFEILNGQFYRARRSSGSLLTDMIGIPSGTDDVRILTTGDFNIVNGSLSNILTVKNGGNVGIGTTSPGQLLTIQNTSSNPYLSIIGGASATMGILLGTTGNTVDGQILYSNSTQHMAFVTNSSRTYENNKRWRYKNNIRWYNKRSYIRTYIRCYTIKWLNYWCKLFRFRELWTFKICYRRKRAYENNKRWFSWDWYYKSSKLD